MAGGMTIAFIHSGPPISGDALSRGPLGGTETALIGMSRALASNPGNRVFVFTDTASPGTYDGVRWLPLGELASWAGGESADVLISIRQWIPFILPIKARRRVYFSPDAYDQPFLHRAFDATFDVNGERMALPLFEPRFFSGNVDAFFCVGKWQAETFVNRLGFPAEKIHVTGNGVFLENFAPRPLAERGKRLIYSSTPFRGLEHLLRLFPSVRASCPEATLDVFSGMGVYGMAKDEDEKLYGLLYRLAAQVGAVSHGSVRQDELARALCASRVFAYPNTFEETFCIAVLEAQAAGTPVVTSRKGALSERVQDGVDGFLIDGHPGETGYDAAFAAAVGRLLSDDALWEKMSRACRVKAASFSYAALARRWENEFLASRPDTGAASLPPFPLQLPPVYEIPHPANPRIKIRVDAKTSEALLAQVRAAYGF